MFNQYSAIYVYGYNNWGRNIHNKIKILYPQKQISIITSKLGLNVMMSSQEKNVCLLEDVKVENDAVAIVGVNPCGREELISTLKEKGFEHVIVYNRDIDNYINDSIVDLPKLELRFLAVCVGQACNLKCLNCSNFAPHAKKENMRYSVEKIKGDLDKALPFFSQIDTFHIQGGEPFLYTDLKQLLLYIKSKYSHILKRIQIATNGTIIPSEEILNTIKECDVTIRISNYPVTTNAEKLIDKLNEMGIAYRVYNFANHTGEWSDTGDLEYSVSADCDVVKQVFECAWNTCFTIEDGLIGRCSRSIPALTLQKLHKREGDYVDLRNEVENDKFYSYFVFTSPMECCSHCKSTNGEPIIAAIQIQ